MPCRTIWVYPAGTIPSSFHFISGTIDGTGINNLYRIDPASSLLTQQVALTSYPGAVAYFSPTFTNNNPTTVLPYGDNQTLLPGGIALPLVVRVLDQNGLPIAGAGVNFAPGSGAVNPVNTVTGADGQAMVDAEGMVTITDRIKEMIKVKGIGVAPAELEDLLLGHERVEDVAVLGVSDEYAGERPKAYVVLKTGEGEEGVGREILAYVKERKVRHKWVNRRCLSRRRRRRAASGRDRPTA